VSVGAWLRGCATEVRVGVNWRGRIAPKVCNSGNSGGCGSEGVCTGVKGCGCMAQGV